MKDLCKALVHHAEAEEEAVNRLAQQVCFGVFVT